MTKSKAGIPSGVKNQIICHKTRNIATFVEQTNKLQQ